MNFSRKKPGLQPDSAIITSVRVSCAVYKVVMKVYPHQFRQRFGEDMQYVFTEMCIEAVRESGWWGMAGVWVHTLLDLATTAVKERLLAIGYRRANMIDTTEFDSQIVSSFQYMSRRLRSGYSVLQCFETLAERAPEPTASHFQQAVTDWKAGKDFDLITSELLQRVPSDALKQVFDVIQVQRREGGNLADRLDTLIPALENQVGRGIPWSSDLPDCE